MKQIRKRLTYANVMSSIAVFLVIGGATALAAGQLGKNTVGSKQLKKNAVSAAKIKNGAVSEAKIAKDAVTGDKVKDGSLTGSDINLGTLGTVPNAANAANAEKLGGQTPSAFQPRIRWAFVAANGTIIRQSGGISASGSTGLYQLNFGGDVSNSAISAVELDNGTFGGSVVVMSCADSGKPGFGVCFEGAEGNPNFIKVATADTGSASASPQGFYVAAIG